MLQRIRVDEVTDEIKRLRRLWLTNSKDHATRLLDEVLAQEEIGKIDLFDQVQLAAVIEVCRNEISLSAAGRRLFSNTRTHKKMANDADRLSKYLSRFGLDWKRIREISIR